MTDHSLPPPFRRQGQQLGADGDTTCFCDLYTAEQMLELDCRATEYADLNDRQAGIIADLEYAMSLLIDRTAWICDGNYGPEIDEAYAYARKLIGRKRP